MRSLMFLLLATLSAGMSQDVKLSDAQALEIGRRIWKNESGGTVSGLTAWNAGEQFASLGIAHFIWYPAGEAGSIRGKFSKIGRLSGEPRYSRPGMAPWVLSMADQVTIHRRFPKSADAATSQSAQGYGGLAGSLCGPSHGAGSPENALGSAGGRAGSHPRELLPRCGEPLGL